MRSSASSPVWRPGASRRAATSSGSISRSTPAELLARAEAAGVTFVKGSDFYPAGGGERSARLAFSFASPSEIGEGVSTLSALLRV